MSSAPLNFLQRPSSASISLLPFVPPPLPPFLVSFFLVGDVLSYASILSVVWHAETWPRGCCVRFPNLFNEIYYFFTFSTSAVRLIAGCSLVTDHAFGDSMAMKHSTVSWGQFYRIHTGIGYEIAAGSNSFHEDGRGEPRMSSSAHLDIYEKQSKGTGEQLDRQ